MTVIQNLSGSNFRRQQAEHALAAALVHDVGHGMFSHAFEAIGKEFDWPMAKHETVSQELIRQGEIAEVLNQELGKGYAENVADVIAKGLPDNLYESVVSSQFDADRLDYMQRDRMMTGIQSSGVDPTWLLANLEIADVTLGADDAVMGSVQTLVLGKKAVQTAESYVLALFHLYPNVYLHKATRGLEMLFGALMRRLVQLHSEGHAQKSGLSVDHPLFRFMAEPADVDRMLALDDAVFLGALCVFADAPDPEVRRLARAISGRRLLRCTDISQLVEVQLAKREGETKKARKARIDSVCAEILTDERFRAQSDVRAPVRFLADRYSRSPYKRFQDSQTPLNQILIRDESGRAVDMSEFSPIVASAERFDVNRIYTFRDDSEAADLINAVAQEAIGKSGHGDN